MDFSEAKGLYVGEKPVKYAWLNGRQVWPSDKYDHIGILLTDGSIVPYSQTADSYPKEEVVGVTYKDADAAFCIALDDLGKCYWASRGVLSEDPEGVMVSSLRNVADDDYQGRSNTDILAPMLQDKNWAVWKCRDYMFPNGSQGYLGALGEYCKIIYNIGIINELLAKCSGTPISTLEGDNYWSSTLNSYAPDHSSRIVWIWNGNGYVDGGNCQGLWKCRPLGEFKMSDDDQGQAVRDSLVLWYDIRRQGATNEGMAANPVLRDLSGNGHDATCYNFAWSGMSGIGGYPLLAKDWIVYRSTSNRNGNSVTITSINEVHAGANDYLLYWFPFGVESITGTYTIPHINLTIDNPNGLNLTVGLNTVEEREKYGAFNDSRTIDIPETTYELENQQLAIGIFYKDVEPNPNANITVTINPNHPDALVSDGVDDYAQVTGLPILTKERGYTVVVKREILKLNTNSCIAQKRKGNNQSFSFERNREDILICTNWGHINNIDISAGLEITYQTSKSYNGTKKLNAGDYKDADTLVLFTELNCCKCVLYSFLLFDRDLTEDEIEWVKGNMVEHKEVAEDWYGVEFYTTSPYPDCIRIGNMDLHRSLPVQSAMKGCLLNDDGEVVKYLDENDWTSETRDGSQGQVMVEMPQNAYWRFETEGNVRRVKFSTKPLDGFTQVPQGYVSAYEATMQRSTSKLASVATADPDYRGGENDREYDGTSRSLLGRPVLGFKLTQFRFYARKRKNESTEWNCYVYDMHKLLYWLFVVEYATLNSQKAFNPYKDVNGFAQGGLGNGVTNLDHDKLHEFNDLDPFIPCGYTDIIGNGTGQVGFTMPPEYDASGEANYAGEYSPDTAYTDGQWVTQGEDLYECIADAVAGTAITDTTYFTKHNRTVTNVIRYRGIENPFGHITKTMDGINLYLGSDVEEGGDGLLKVYVCHDPSLYSSDGVDGYDYVGNASRSTDEDDGDSVKEVILGEGGEIIASVKAKRTYTQYFCDSQYPNTLYNNTIYAVALQKGSSNGAKAGFVNIYSFLPSLNIETGTRLCFIPKQ